MTDTPVFKTRAKLGTVTLGKESNSVGFTIHRTGFTLEQAEEFLLASQLNVNICKDENPEQKRLPGIPADAFCGIADVKGYRAETDGFKGRLVFTKKINRTKFGQFAQCDVVLKGERLGDAASGPSEEETANEAA